MNESSGLKAHRTLAPANAKYTSRQMMWGGKVTRKRFRAAKRTEIAATAGQKILGRMSLCIMSARGKAKMNKGDTIRAKAHAEIGTIVHLSIIGVEDAGRLNSKECIEAFIFWERLRKTSCRKRAWRPVLFCQIDAGALTNLA